MPEQVVSKPAAVSGAQIDLSELEVFPDFRADYLYFIRLAGTYIQSIFWDVFSTNNKKAKKRRYEMLRLADANIPANTESNNYLRACILEPKLRTLQTLDCYKTDFIGFLESLPDPTKKVFEDTLKHNHAIFLDFPSFLRVIKTLKEKRDYLEHYEERVRKGAPKQFREEKALAYLGLLLPPEMLNLFRGRVHRYHKKLDDHGAAGDMQEIRDEIRELFKNCIRQRRERTKKLYAEERTRNNLPRHKRKYLVSPNQRWRRAYDALQSKRTDYGMHRFKMRYYFIGEQNIRRIKARLSPECPETDKLNVRRHIEEFYELTVNVNLVLHRALSRIKSEKKLNGPLRDIRNAVAHNGVFWAVKDKQGRIYGVDEVFDAVMIALVKLPDGRVRANDFYTSLERLFKRQKYAIADFQGDPPSMIHVRRWSVENRETYKDEELYALDKRLLIKKEVALWRRALDQAKLSIC